MVFYGCFYGFFLGLKCTRSSVFSMIVSNYIHISAVFYDLFTVFCCSRVCFFLFRGFLWSFYSEPCYDRHF